MCSSFERDWKVYSYSEYLIIILKHDVNHQKMDHYFFLNM